MNVHTDSMRIRTAIELGALIRDRRQAAGFTQTELASKAGVSRRWLASLEAGKATSAFELILRTLDALGLVISVDEEPEVSVDVDLDQVLGTYDETPG